MDYLKVYNQLVEKAKNESRVKSLETYYENHHIKPKSLYPELDKDLDNLVLLTPREHYIAHWLLTKIYPVKSMAYAFLAMCNKSSNKYFTRDYKVNSKVYSKLKKEFSSNNPAKTVEARNKISKAKKGSNHHFYGVAPENAPGFKSEVFNLAHKDGRTYNGNRTEIHNNLGISKSKITELIKGTRYTSKGWSLEGVKKPPAKKGIKANGADLNMYCWFNKDSGFGYVCNRHDAESLLGLKKRSLHSLLYNERNSVFGWELIR